METTVAKPLFDARQTRELVRELAGKIANDATLTAPIALVGIRSRGELLALRVAAALVQHGLPKPDVGALDITMYRDDITFRDSITIPQGTDVNFAIDGRAVVLVDDVLETGRTVRAALDAIVDFGRPRLIRLAVLVDRGRREFPIQADYVGVKLPVEEAGRKVVVKLQPTDAEDLVALK